MTMPSRVAAFILLALAGCASKPILTPDPKLRPSGMVAASSDVDWQTVLTRVATPDGYVRWSQFDDPKSAARPALERYLALLAVISPDNRPDLFELPSDITTYWINAYNAACIYGELLRHEAAPVPALYDQDLFYFGQRSLTLRQIEMTKLNVQADPRILFALNRCTRSSPPLRSEAYLANKINFQLSDQTARCLTDRRFVVIDQHVARLNQALIIDHRQDFINAAQQRSGGTNLSLMEALQVFAGKRATLPAVTSWTVLPYDGSLNIPPAKTAPTTQKHTHVGRV